MSDTEDTGPVKVCKGSPPSGIVHWHILTRDGRNLVGRGQTAFVAAASVGLMLSEVDTIER